MLVETDGNLSEVRRTKIQRFYAGSNVFITGGTGFLGKLLIEKLLRSCGDLNAIYLLIRPKKGKPVHSRCDELFDDVVFDRLKNEAPKFRHKIFPLAGDCSLPELGLSSDDRKLLENEIHVVFHVAATVRFDEKIRLATAINVKGTRDVLQLARKMPQLRSIVHVSTAYAFCPHSHIEEKIYNPSMDHGKLIALTESADDKRLDQITRDVIKGWPNTYTFTKAVAEHLVREESDGLPVGVFRPSIVIATYKEPVRAWVDNMYGVTGVCAGAGVGILRTMNCDPAATSNTIPADTTINSLICTAWDVSKKCGTYSDENHIETPPKSPPITVYNYVSTQNNSLTWGNYMEKAEKFGVNYPSVKAVWYYSLTLNKYWLVHWMYVLILHLLPGLLVDTVLVCLRKQPRMLKVYKHIIKYNRAISYFCTKSWRFEYGNVVGLWERLEKRDKEEFFFDMRQVDWEEYFQEYYSGVRKYLLKDDEDTLPAALVKWRIFYWLHHLGKYAVLYFILRFVWYLLTITTQAYFV